MAHKWPVRALPCPGHSDQMRTRHGNWSEPRRHRGLLAMLKGKPEDTEVLECNLGILLHPENRGFQKNRRDGQSKT